MPIACPRCGKQFKGKSVGSHVWNCDVTPEEIFWAKVDKSAGPDSCWFYDGFKKWDGYGWLARNLDGRKSRYITAHRYAWILTNGPVLDGLHVLHQCDNPPCCNPAHMRLGTHAENMAEMSARGRANGGKGEPRFNRPEKAA